MGDLRGFVYIKGPILMTGALLSDAHKACVRRDTDWEGIRWSYGFCLVRMLPFGSLMCVVCGCEQVLKNDHGSGSSIERLKC